MPRVLLCYLLFAALATAVHAESTRELPTPEKLAQDFAAGNSQVDYIIAAHGDLTQYADVVVEILSNGLRKDDSFKSGNALQLAGAIGEKSADRLAPAIVKYLIKPFQGKGMHLDVQLPAARALVKMGAVGLDRATEVLNNHTTELNAAAAAIGIAFTWRARGMVPLYAKILDNANGNKETLLCALDALQYIGIGLDPAAPSLLKIAQNDSDPELGLKCISMISLGSENLKPWKAVLIRVVEDERLTEAEHALIGLFNLGDESPEVIEALKKRALMHNGSELSSVVELLRHMRAPTAVEFLRAVAEGKYESRDADVRAVAMLGLLDHGVDLETLRPAIIELLKQDDWIARTGAAKVLAKLKNLDPETAKVIEDHLQAARKMIEAAAEAFASRRKSAEVELARAEAAEADEKLSKKDREAARRNILQLAAATQSLSKETIPRSPADHFFIWGHAVLAKHAVEPGPHILEIWNTYKRLDASANCFYDPLEALATFPKGDAALIDEARLLFKEAKNPRQRADLAGLLAYWNIDAPSQLNVLRSTIDDDTDGFASSMAITWIERMGKKTAGALTGDLQRWKADCHSWSTRLEAGMLLRQWMAQDKP